MTTEERAQLIDRYEQGYAAVVAALDGIGEEEWAQREAPGEWSVREIVHHLGDSEMAAAVNLRLMLAQDNPVLAGYDHEQWARVLHQGFPVEGSLAAFAGARAATVPLLRSMTEADWLRAGTFADGEAHDPATWISWYGGHAHGHADQIRRARAAR
ncbi:MAG: DinB family protein [Thermomicrobiales bacterium]